MVIGQYQIIRNIKRRYEMFEKLINQIKELSTIDFKEATEKIY